MAKPRNKKYRPKHIQRIPKIDGWVEHHSGYRYRKSYEAEWYHTMNTFAQDLWDAYSTGNRTVTISDPNLNPTQLGFYHLLWKDYMDGTVGWEYTTLEE